MVASDKYPLEDQVKVTILLGLAFLWPLLSWTADTVQPLDVKLGLWETTTINEMSGMPPMPAEVLAKLTPEQRAKMEGVFKARAAQGPKTTTRRTCLDKQKLDKSVAFGDDSDKSCRRTIISSSRSKQDAHLECTDEKMKRSGDLHIEAINPENIKGSMQMTAAGGSSTMNIKVAFTAKWIGSSCAELKGRDQ
jgi:hypothetical protein